MSERVTIDIKSQPLFGGPVDYKPNPGLFEAEWVPKIKAYNDKLNAAIPKEYLVPAELLPDTDLDTTPFNATEVPGRVLDKETLEITGLTAVEIAQKIAEGQLTAVQTLTAFIKRATIAQQLTRCAMEIFFDEGLARARALDEYFAQHGRTVGPLHGVPMSLKEHYNYAGHVTHGGFVCAIDNLTPEFSQANQTFYDLGAVFYIRTTEPQSLMHLDSLNNITPRGRNCYKTSLSPGGSSSGEGALIGMRGSPLGIGSDIGGSIRGPAAFNGIYGLKPSSRRISMQGVYSAGVDVTNEMILCVLGPMANSVEDLEFLFKSYIETEPWTQDEASVPIPWRSVPVPKAHDLTIAIVYDDGVVKPHPPVIRALKEAELKLKAAGVNVIVWDPHRVYECVQVAFQSFLADGGYAPVKFFEKSGEPLAPLSEYFLSLGKGSKPLTAVEIEYYTHARDVLRAEYLKLFNERKVDFLLSPTFFGTAPKPSTPKYWGYTVLYNMLDLSCVTLPSGTFGDKQKDLKEEHFKPRSNIEEFCEASYSPEDSDGMPVGLTLVGRRYTEEKVLKAAKVVDSIFKSA